MDHFLRSAMSLSLEFGSAPKGNRSDAPPEFIAEGHSKPRPARRLDLRRHRRSQSSVGGGVNGVPLFHQIFGPAA
ncbi:hypothetical protein [Bradyrhizobium sp.]|uniref:hypothetical protein n=1 Tax=Bradyrhizobium sp. TaxID=376 RepID=UPI00391D47FB